jgi:NitT/TauT family transport system substrate-binding protein
MNLLTKQLGACVITLAIAATATACGSGNAATSTAVTNGTTTINLAIPPVGDSLPVYDAIDKGYFKAAGIDVKLTPAANGATTINALVAGSTDMALVSYPSLISAHASGLPVVIAANGISGTDQYASGLYVLADSPIHTPADMLGKKFATPSLGSVGDVWFRGVLMKQGLDFHQVQFVEIPQANMASALKAGDVQGIFQTEPTLSATKASLPVRPIAFQNGPQGLFATSEKLIQSNPKAVAGFRAALAKAVGDINADPHGVASALMPKYTKLTAATAAKMGLPQYVTNYDAAGVQQVIDLMVKEGLIKKSFDSKQLYQNVS